MTTTNITLTTQECERLTKIFNSRIKRNQELIDIFTPTQRKHYTRTGVLSIEHESIEFDEKMNANNDKRRNAIEFYKLMLDKLKES